MTSLRSLDGDLAGIHVTDLTDHDNVRILAQKRLQRSSKSKPRFVVHVYLVYAGQIYFAGVFGRRNIDAGFV